MPEAEHSGFPPVNPASSPALCGTHATQEFLMSGKTAEKPKQHAEEERTRIKKEEDKVTVSSDESFPASDPPSFNPGVTGAADVKKKKH
jgi:hypothetical protein